jgi:hypothetical protein
MADESSGCLSDAPRKIPAIYPAGVTPACFRVGHPGDALLEPEHLGPVTRQGFPAYRIGKKYRQRLGGHTP